MALKLKAYLVGIYLITIITLTGFLYLKFVPIKMEDFGTILFFSLATAVTESVSIVFYELSFSTTFAITLATFTLFGPLTSIIVIILGFSLRVIKLNDGKYRYILNTPLYGTLFNYCALALPVLIANYFFVLFGGELGASKIGENTWCIVLFGIIYCTLNTTIVSILIAINTRKNIIYCLLNNLKTALMNFLIMTPFGIFLSILFTQNGYIGVLFLLISIILLRYTFLLHEDSKTQYIQTVDALMNSIEARDKYTEGHSQRVAEISVQIGKVLRYNQWKLEQLKMAAMLHDVGKIGVSDNILNKPGKLNDEEYSIIKSHPTIGSKILGQVRNLEGIAKIIKHHHERFDGKGYPDGKKGDELPMKVYIIQLADCVDAMATDRPYRRALSNEEIIREIENNIGTQFHPKIAEIYLNILKK